MAVCDACIEWATVQKRTFLGQQLRARLIALYLTTEAYSSALELSSTLLGELKRLDDKPQLVVVQLMESRAFFALGNGPKARCGLAPAPGALVQGLTDTLCQGVADVGKDHGQRHLH